VGRTPAGAQSADHRHALLLLTRSERPCHAQSSNSFNEGASSHCRPQGLGPVRTMLWSAAITAGIYTRRNGVSPSFCAATILRIECPLWVITGHFAAFNGCLLYPRKRTSLGTAVMSVRCQ